MPESGSEYRPGIGPRPPLPVGPRVGGGRRTGPPEDRTPRRSLAVRASCEQLGLSADELRRSPAAAARGPGGERVPAPTGGAGGTRPCRSSRRQGAEGRRGQHNWVPGAAKRPAPRASYYRREATRPRRYRTAPPSSSAAPAVEARACSPPGARVGGFSEGRNGQDRLPDGPRGGDRRHRRRRRHRRDSRRRHRRNGLLEASPAERSEASPAERSEASPAERSEASPAGQSEASPAATVEGVTGGTVGGVTGGQSEASPAGC